MHEVSNKIDSLGYDLMDLDSLVYLGIDRTVSFGHREAHSIMNCISLPKTE